MPYYHREDRDTRIMHQRVRNGSFHGEETRAGSTHYDGIRSRPMPGVAHLVSADGKCEKCGKFLPGAQDRCKSSYYLFSAEWRYCHVYLPIENNTAWREYIYNGPLKEEIQKAVEAQDWRRAALLLVPQKSYTFLNADSFITKRVVYRYHTPIYSHVSRKDGTIPIQIYRFVITQKELDPETLNKDNGHPFSRTVPEEEQTFNVKVSCRIGRASPMTLRKHFRKVRERRPSRNAVVVGESGMINGLLHSEIMGAGGEFIQTYEKISQLVERQGSIPDKNTPIDE